MKAIEIKTVEQLEVAYNRGILFGNNIISNVFSESNGRMQAKCSYHLPTFKQCSFGTQLKLVKDFIFTHENPNARVLLNEFLTK